MSIFLDLFVQVLPFKFEEDECTLGLNDLTRADNLRQLLTYLFDALCPNSFKVNASVICLSYGSSFAKR